MSGSTGSRASVQLRQFFNDFGDAVQFPGKVVGHAEVVPALSMG